MRILSDVRREHDEDGEASRQFVGDERAPQ